LHLNARAERFSRINSESRIMRPISRRALIGATALAALGFGAHGFATRRLASAASGEVNIYSSRHYPSDEVLFQAFTAATGIGVNEIQGKAEELMERVKLEGDQSPCDIFITVDAGNLWRGEVEGLFQPVSSGELSANIPVNLRHPDGLWFAFSKRARIIIHDRYRVAAGDIVDYEGLADPRWAKRVLIRSSNNIYNQSLVASMIAHHGAEETEAWAKSLVANMAREPKGGDTDQIKALLAGEGDLAVSNTYYFARLWPKTRN
jgi:iron(III) transport system substrate-binding protein